MIRSFAHRLADDATDLPDEGPLASFAGATGWLNSDPLTPEGLRGRVVLVDVWTYTCINWLRTLPYVRAWNERYREHGLTIIGVHTPEFGFEHDVDNIVAAARAFGVMWPIAIDNDYGVWRALDNHFWPAAYVADANGRIRFRHFGEGEYVMTEMAIQQLLRDSGASGFDDDLVTVDPVGLEVAADWGNVRTPETYTGYRQASGFTQAESAAFDRRGTYEAPGRLPLNTWALTGDWTVAAPASHSNGPGARVVFQFHARDLNLVMGPATRGARIPFRVFLDGEPAVAAPGTDVRPDATGILDDQRTYQLIRQTGPIREHRFEIEFAEPGAEVFCFTFG
jgi:thiol-disulfide isomerase/thioredoxin